MAHYRPAKLSDCMQLAPRLREADVKELAASSGEEPLEALIISLQVSSECNAIIDDDGLVIGLFGVAIVDEDLGTPWLLGADGIKDISREFIRGCHSWVNQIQEEFPVLCNFVHAENKIAIRWLKKLGFTIINLVPEFGVGKEPFYEFVRIKSNV